MNIKRLFLTLLTLQCFTVSLFASISPRYGLSDLKILYKNNNYAEFLDHALDILPSKRQKKWKEMTVSVATDYLSYVLKKKTMPQNDLVRILKISNWPLLKADEFYTQKRDLVFLKDIKACIDHKSAQCEIKADMYYSDYDHDPIFDYAFINTMAPYFKNEQLTIKLWPYTQNLRKDKMSEFYCNKDTFKDIIIENLSLMAQKNELMKEDIHKDCFKVLRPSIKKMFYSKNLQEKTAAKSILQSFNSLKPNELHLYNLISFMNTTKLNHDQSANILKSLKELRKDENKRKVVLNEYLSLDPLPDNAFNDPKEKLNIVKLKVLNQNFPELIDSYTNTCVNYLTGHIRYPNGNPTPQCHTVFEINNILNLIPNSTVKQYKKATYFKK